MSDHRHAGAKDRGAEPGRRASRRAGDDGGPPPENLPPNGAPPQGRKSGLGVGGWVSIAVTGVMVLGTLGGYTLYRNTLAGFNTIDLSGKLSANRPVNETGAINVLLVGSDTREGDNLQYGQKMLNAGKRTDTIILMHISPNRDKATLISFPRDSVVDMPACKSEAGAPVAARHEMINAAYNEGGITCTIDTLESLTQIPIDHFVEVDFTGFKNIVDALDGVRICLKEPVNSKKAKLTLSAGWHNLKGEEALGYVRLRDYGDGSDIQRIKRQQVFLSKVVDKATSSALLTDPGKLFSFIGAASKSVRMDKALANDTQTLVKIAQSAKALTASGVKFITVPWGADPDDKNRVVWRQPAANELFEAIRSDTEVLPTAAPTGPAKPTVKNEQVRVQVFNGTDTPGRAKEVADKLTAQGFVVTNVGNARPVAGNVPTTTLRYAKKDTEGPAYGDTLAARLSGEKRAPVAGKVKPISTEAYVPPTPIAKPPTTGPILQLVIGADWPGVRVPTKIPDSLKDQVVDNKTDPCQ
ncbi:transcriptional attenuator, LytR family [Streptosporangium subroseum]|uniref:Transcriptional attenuator, LytR family n=1 Tax=Streptosporangium subroseum TaxID=106412 RepID=A0A239NZM9_9ACTN|nr:LCP family protein [Streptosporangium subroseum]SNT59903.1 transcriptional attenuator, LytR family [Streptosporangium subroseum]